MCHSGGGQGLLLFASFRATMLASSTRTKVSVREKPSLGANQLPLVMVRIHLCAFAAGRKKPVG
jgi:hypothetical protein